MPQFASHPMCPTTAIPRGSNLPQMKLVTDCLVVGGGVIGLSIAWELLNRGLTCTVADQATVGKGCSWAGAGILPPARLDTALDPIDRLRGLSHQLHPVWSERLRTTTGIDNGYRLCGGIYLATSPGEAASLAGQTSYWSEYGISAEPLSLDELSKKEPAIFAAAGSNYGSDYGSDQQPSPNDSLRSAFWVPDEAQIRPPAHLQALVEGCKRLGCKILDNAVVEGLTVESLTEDSTIATGSSQQKAPNSASAWDINCGNHQISAGHIVLACGAWASRFSDPLGRTEAVFPVRGQAILFQAKPGLLRSVINEGNRYLVPRDDGVVYVGSNEEEVGLVEGTTPEIIESLFNWATTWVPALRDAKILRTISGLRPGSFDGFPHLGRCSLQPNLYFATGHYRSGLHLSCATAEVIADMITAQQPKLDGLELTLAR